MRKPMLSRSDVVEVLGLHDDEKIAAIIATGATAEDLMAAFAWASEETDVMGEARRPLSGTVAEVYDILVADDEDVGERR